MGSYYCLINLTRNQKISGYWKSCPWCDLYLVMHQFGWLPTDQIVSYAMGESEDFVYDSKHQKMHLKSLIRPEDDVDEPSDNIVIPDCRVNPNQTTLNGIAVISDNLKTFGYDYHLFADGDPDKHQHIPQWTSSGTTHTCQICNYSFDKSSLADYAKKYDPTFCGN